MQHHDFRQASEIITHAGYDYDQQVLYLTYRSGPATIAYLNVAPSLYEELVDSVYPDVCLRFRIQAHHPFRRMEPSFQPLDLSFVK